MRLILTLILFSPLFLTAQTKYNSESRKLFKQAEKEYKTGNATIALGLFEECVKADSRHAEGYLNISLIQYSKKQMGESFKNAKRAFANNKFDAAIYAQLGKCYYHATIYDSSAAFLNKSVDMGMTNETIYIYLGKSNLKLDEYEDAKEYLGKALEINSENPITYNVRGMVFYSEGEYADAEVDFEKALELNDNSAGLYVNLANCELENQKFEEALEHINQGMAIADDEGKTQLFLLLGNYYHKNGDLDLALENFEKAYDLDKNNAHILNNQAAVLLERDDFESAITKCNMALEINPEMMEAYYNRGIANEMLRKVEEACSDWEQAFILGSEKAEEFLNGPTCNE